MDKEVDNSVSKEFNMIKVYIIDASFEAPLTEARSAKQGWRPEINIDLQSEVSRRRDDKCRQVILTITVTAKHGETPAYIAEVKQAGFFLIDGFSEKEEDSIFRITCLEMLFPYARECIADMVRKGGFPQMHLAPVNFIALHEERLNQSPNEAANE